MTKTDFLKRQFGLVNLPDLKYKQYFTFDELHTLLEEYEKAINYSPCCTQLKNKEELTFKEWCEINKYTKTKSGKYVDTQDLWFTEKALLKIYNLDTDL